MPSTVLYRATPSETFNKLTVSCWFKGMADGTQRSFWGLFDDNDSNKFFHLYYSSNGSLYGYWKQTSFIFTLGTTQKFRDPSAWYHFVMTMDTTLATAGDRIKFYVNGEQVTSFEDSLDTITQNLDCDIMNGTTYGRMQLGGAKQSGTQYYWNGSMSHCHMCVGYAYDASYFGETDATSGIWKIKTGPSVSYGDNGGFWLKDGSQLTDSSPNSNTLTVGGGTLTPTKDNPSNNFPVMNPNMGEFGSAYGFNFSQGNLYVDTTSSNDCGVPATFAMEGGKWYWEVSAAYVPSVQSACVGIVNTDKEWANASTGTGDPYGFVYVSNGQKKRDGTAASYGDDWGPATSGGDVIGVAYDVDNRKLYFSKNGTWQDSGDPTSGATGTGAAYTIPTGRIYMPYACERQSGYSAEFSFNFGNGYFGNQAGAYTAISSPSADAAGIGAFKYAPPTGYYALCTKNIKAYGG